MTSLSKIIYIMCLSALLPLAPAGLHAQSRTPAERWFAPRTVSVLVSERAASALSDAFIDAVKSTPDPSQVAIGAERILSLFPSSEMIAPIRLRPMAHQHSVALPALRRATNPDLFTLQPVAPGVVTNNERLRKAESRIARWFVLEYAADIAPEVAAKLLLKSSLVEAAEPKTFAEVLYRPSDSLLSQQWGLDSTRAMKAWDIVKGDTTMLIAVVDNGVDWSHRDLNPGIFRNWKEMGWDSVNNKPKNANGIDDDENGFIDDWQGWDFAGPVGTSQDNDTRTEEGHGTHVTGIAAGTGDNKTGIAGLAYGARILPVKGGRDNSRYIDWGYNGLIYAADMGAKVINCSWGNTATSLSDKDVVEYVAAKDIAIVAASGNSGLMEDYYPATYDDVLSVTTIDGTAHWGGGNFGTRVAVAAPGVSIISTFPGNEYGHLGGTSMAAPHVTGTVALVRQRFPQLNATQAMQRVRMTSRPLAFDPNRPDLADLTGRGTIDVERAVSSATVRSARIHNFLTLNNDGSDYFTAGSSGGIVVSVKNYLDPVVGLEAKIEVFEGGEFFKLLGPQTLPFGDIGTGEIVSNIKSGFLVHVEDAAPLNTRVTIKLTFTSQSDGYKHDVDYFSFVVNPGFLDLNQNHVTATFDSKGSIGYNNSPINTEGHGLAWTTAPSFINPWSKSVLYHGGLMVGRDEEHVVASAPEVFGEPSGDFSPSIAVRYEETRREHAVQQLTSRFDDRLADSLREVGVDVVQRAYAFDTASASDGIILEYILRTRTPRSGESPGDEIAAGIYLDLDIGLSGTENRVYYREDSNVALVYRLEPGYPFVGIKPLGPNPVGADLIVHAINNNGSGGGISIYDNFTPDEKWQAMTESKTTAGPGDISMAMSYYPLALASSDSIVLRYIVAFGADASDVTKSSAKVYAAIAEIEKLWINKPETMNRVESGTSGERAFQIYPNPATASALLKWDWTGDDLATITLSDVLGRTVWSGTARGQEISIPLSELTPGAYHAIVSSGGRVFQRQLIKK